jgi:phosphoribosyl 1,2-cyclic phosphate phosphodiesterase
MRSSVLFEKDGRNILVDTSTDLRTQALSAGLARVDAVLFTHPHADHLHGIDDLRSFNRVRKGPIPCYGSAVTLDRVRELFSYIFTENDSDGWKPELDLHLVTGPFDVEGVSVTPIEIDHGQAKILGYRVGSVAYLTDCSGVPDEAARLLGGLDILIVGALRQKPHPSHFSVDQAVEAARKLGPKRTILTHLGHSLDFTVDGEGLPEGVEFATDGMTVEV